MLSVLNSGSAGQLLPITLPTEMIKQVISQNILIAILWRSYINCISLDVVIYTPPPLMDWIK